MTMTDGKPNESDPRFLLKDRLPKGEFRKTDEEPLSVDQETRQDQVEHVGTGKPFAELSRREQEKKQRG